MGQVMAMLYAIVVSMIFKMLINHYFILLTRFNFCCHFTAQDVNPNQGNYGNNGYNGNQNNANNQVFPAGTQVGQQFGSPDYFNNHPESK